LAAGSGPHSIPHPPVQGSASYPLKKRMSGRFFRPGSVFPGSPEKAKTRKGKTKINAKMVILKNTMSVSGNVLTF
jgi:hypothetical protein